MPELPEVELTRRKLLPLIGLTLENFVTDWPRSLQQGLTADNLRKKTRGLRVLDVRRQGKLLFIDLGTDGSASILLSLHKRMSGSLFIVAAGEGEPSHVHHRFLFQGGTQLLFQDPRKFGTIWCGSAEELAADPYIGSLGPDALDIPLVAFVACLAKRKGSLKTVLLNQRVIAGIGNIIVDETLFDARLHPLRRVETLTKKQQEHVLASLQAILNASIAAQGSSVKDWSHPDGSRGGFQDMHRVYNREGLPCLRCKGTIVRMVVASRGTWVCMECQK